MFQRTVAAGIEIRQFELADAEPVFALADRNRTRLREWLPWVDQTRSPDHVREFIVRAFEQYHADRGPNAGIWVEGEIAGSIGCHAIDPANRNCHIGYWIDADRQGQGIVNRCCEVLLDYLFRELDLHRVVIQCGTGNHRSCRIPERLGFTREGVARQAQWVNDRWVDLVVWSMLSGEWRKGR
jgi:ribosomal-protein-serine acetyltransferase